MRDVKGVLRGIVTDTQDPRNLGRIRLRIPTLESGSAYESQWIPVASPMSGPARGFFFSPEVGDEALVAFDNGNIDHPYVIGYLYNGQQKPPETELKNRVMLTPGGNTLRFEDKDGAKKVVLKTDAGFMLEMDEAARRITITDAGSESITITATDGKIKVQAGMKVVIEAPQIELTEGATHPLVFGDVLLTYLNSMMKTAFDGHTHAGQMALGILPVTPQPPNALMPTTPVPLNSERVKTG